MKPCQENHACVWGKDTGTAIKCVFPRCVVQTTKLWYHDTVLHETYPRERKPTQKTEKSQASQPKKKI